jgi:hypothetical protein
MAELITQGQATFVDINPFRFSRFQENQPICGPYEYVCPRISDIACEVARRAHRFLTMRSPPAMLRRG